MSTVLSALHMLVAFIVVIVVLVSLHELGHLVVARLCGIKVLRFSVGMGKPFYTKRWRNIEWCLAPFPIGGYVKMVDTREGEVAPEDLPVAFDKQHPLKRIAVVLAGPFTNLILAVLLYWFSFGVGGITQIRPYVGTVEKGSIAAQAGFQQGDKIISVNNKAVNNFSDAYTEIVLDLETGKINVQVENAQGQPENRIVDAAGTQQATDVAKRKIGLGISPVKVSNTIGEVRPNTPAQRAGLQKGDQIIAINNQAMPTWEAWSQIIRENPNRSLKIQYIRQGTTYDTQITPTAEGRIGVLPQSDKAWDDKVRYHYTPSFAESMQLGWNKTVNYSAMTLSFFGKLFTGNASLAHISGPITIAEVAGKTAQIGWQPYVEFLALVSVSLGIMNLLPIPVLDGGHFVYYTIELLIGRPISKRAQEWGLRLGISAMLAMMILAFFNDITRLIASFG